jgi:spermidine synthase
MFFSRCFTVRPELTPSNSTPQLVRLVSKRFAEFAGRLYEQPGVRIHVAEARSFVAGSPDRYDLIQLPLLDSFATAAAGTHSLSESYIYTIEAFEQYLDHLRPGGYLAITRWLKLPPRVRAAKLVAFLGAILIVVGVIADRIT